MPGDRPRPTPPELAQASDVEALVDALVAGLPPHVIEAARADYEARGGAFSTSDAFHEERMRGFSDHLVCAHRLEDGRTPAERALAASSDDEARTAWLRALASSERSLFRVEARGRESLLRCLLGGAVLRVALDADARAQAARLREGDVFDGRIAALRGEIRLLPGMIFHREEAHAPLLAMLPRLLAEGRERGVILDGLLRMRMRHDRFTSIHARHLYRPDALATPEIQAASWKAGRAR